MDINFIVVVDDLKDWRPYFPTDQVVSVQDYLFDSKYQEKRSLRLINLCSKTGYLKRGYYCSMLAEARGHRVLPSLKTLNDLGKKQVYLHDLADFQKDMEAVANSITIAAGDEISFKGFFSKARDKKFEALGRKIFEYYPCPLLEVSLGHKNGRLKIIEVSPISISSLEESEEDFFAQSLDAYSSKIWRLPKARKTYKMELAVLIDPEEKQAPSDGKALDLFKDACEKKGVWCEFITSKDIGRLSEFDALFIRKTTSIRNATYRFAQKAQSEGIVVIDDPETILKCTNKIYISNLLERAKIASIPGDFVHDAKKDTLDKLEEKFGLPLVIKIPDGSFSVGVKKAKTKEEAKEIISEFLKKSDLVLVQKFLFTQYDWRVGVLGRKPLFICKYYMSSGHWQIYNHKKDSKSDAFSGDFETFSLDDAPEKVLKIATRAASQIGEGLYGVDLKEDKEGNIYVVEINDNPNIDAGIEDEKLGEELYDRLVQWFIQRVGVKRSET